MGGNHGFSSCGRSYVTNGRIGCSCMYPWVSDCVHASAYDLSPTQTGPHPLLPGLSAAIKWEGWQEFPTLNVPQRTHAYIYIYTYSTTQININTLLKYFLFAGTNTA